jgi:hypothetical protein
MAIIDHQDWDLSEKGARDAQRHREKIDKVIRESIKDAIAEESIITKRNNKKVKIPVKGLKDYRFVYGYDGENVGGIGQGPAKPGDVLGEKSKAPGQGNKAGDRPGIDYMETEVDIDYLIDIMFKDLGLPYIEEKTKVEELVPMGWKFESISKSGSFSRVHKKRTLKESIKRAAAYVHEITEETGCLEDEAYCALEQANGDLDIAINIIKSGTLNKALSGDIFVEDDDLRFKQIEQEVEYHSNCAIIAMMDVSGSMTTDKKYFTRSLLFWLTEFLKKVYNNVAIRFIVHTTEAHLVDEDEFFHKGESGGTMCHTAFDLADYLIETEYPLDRWNVYTVYASDGEDFDMDKTIKSIKKLLDRKVNMISYCEINPEYTSQPMLVTPTAASLIDVITKRFNLETTGAKEICAYKNEKLHMVACSITKKAHIYPALREILFEKRVKS